MLISIFQTFKPAVSWGLQVILTICPGRQVSIIRHTTPNPNQISFWWLIASQKALRTMKTPSHSISLNPNNFSINNTAKWLLELKTTQKCWSMADIDSNTQNKDAFLLIPKVREQTKKQMQPSGGFKWTFLQSIQILFNALSGLQTSYKFKCQTATKRHISASLKSNTFV